MQADREKRIAEQLSNIEPQRVTRVYPPGAMLFRRGEVPTGVFYLQEGNVDLSTRLRQGARRIDDHAEVGSILGLSELFGEKRYERDALCRSLTRVIYVEKDELLQD